MKNVDGNLKIDCGEIFIDGKPIEEFIGESISFNLKRYYWEPKKDITTYELAKCFPIVTAMQTMGSQKRQWQETMDELPENCQRHFELL